MTSIRIGLGLLALALIHACAPTGTEPASATPPSPAFIPVGSSGPPLSLTYQATVPPGFPAPHSPLALPDGVRYSNSGIRMTGGYLAIEVVMAGRPTAQATLSCYGPTLANASTDASGRATIGPLEPETNYDLVVQAAGSASRRYMGIAIRQDETGWARITLESGQTLRGTIRASGQSVAGAVVSDGLNSAVTNDQGRFELQGIASNVTRFTVSKPGYGTLRPHWPSAGSQNGELDGELSATSMAVFVDTSFASSAIHRSFSRLVEAMRARGRRLTDGPPSDGGAWLLVVPSRPFSPEEAARIETYVSQGGKLMVMGEWGGYAGFDNVGTNVLAHRLGLHFNPDLVREDRTGSETLSIQGFERSVLANDSVRAMAVYRACSLFGLIPGHALAWTGIEAYHVQGAEAGSRAVALGGAFRAGKVVALADASAWSDEDADQNGIPNVMERDNLATLDQLLAW
ncbi:hypothetical protein D3C72_459890 [compost metagenome]